MPAFEEWLTSPATLATARTPDSRGELHLAALPPSLQREIRYGLHRHAKTARRTQWRPMDIQAVVDRLAAVGAVSLLDPIVDTMAEDPSNRPQQRIWRDLPIAARSLMLTKETAKEAGWFDPVISGGKPFFGTQSDERRRVVWDLTRISQRWLRDALWDYLYDESLEPDGKRVSAGTVFYRRYGVVLLSYVLEQIRPDHGHDPTLLSAADAHAIRELLNLWFNEQIPVPPLINENRKVDGVLTERARHVLMRNAHIVLRHNKERGRTGPTTEDFILRFPEFPVPARNPLPRPLSFGDFQLLVDPDNLRALDELDLAEVGLSDVWLTQAFQGGRISEVLKLRLGCIGMVGAAQPYLWRDISKARVIDYGIPCHVPIYERLLRRQAITKAKLRTRYRKRLAALDGPGRERLEAEWERTMPLFPGAYLNPDLTLEISYTAFRNAWTKWFASLGLSGITTHQTRATLATSLLNNGAPADLVRQMLGHFSDEALAHYARYNDESMAKHLKQVWAAGPGTDKPGTILLRPGDLNTDGGSLRDRIDLAVIPVEHGICRYGPSSAATAAHSRRTAPTAPKAHANTSLSLELTSRIGNASGTLHFTSPKALPMMTPATTSCPRGIPGSPFSPDYAKPSMSSACSKKPKNSTYAAPCTTTSIRYSPPDGRSTSSRRQHKDRRCPQHDTHTTHDLAAAPPPRSGAGPSRRSRSEHTAALSANKGSERPWQAR